MSDIPCKDCICVPMCMNRKVIPCIRNCSLAYNYLVKSEASHKTVINMDRFIEYCSIMNISLSKQGSKKTIVTYHWEK